MTKYCVFLCITLLCVIPAQISSHRISGRIIGGHNANAGQFPFAAAIYKSTPDGTFFCSGALVLSRWVLTAGQCVDGAVTFNIRLGSNNLSANDPNALRVATDIYYLHPDYDPLTLVNDIGMIEFRMSITYTEYIRPVNIVPSTSLPNYSSVATLGWGQTSDATAGLVDDLQYVFLITLTTEECQLVFGNQISDNMVCAGGNYNEGTCRGDLGSPLIQYGGSSSLVYLVGVSSFISSNGCESTDPSGFTRASPYIGWINNITSST
ncbi:hypothetical protein Zmor_015450 [Zophobas morio]|uniref:Peptidase S1 domain-containing protein n=1 Tax=Zophobas morio TaxID=2755281 RepID=A0AA38IM56_9CUCU|nr:hypothetical protein Zmor_015450 [Zophobas morio]